MEISMRADYALRMIAALVKDPGGTVSVRQAAKDTGVPYSFARAIQHDLAEAGIVENTRGASGGMRLACDPAQTTVLELVEAIQGPIIVGGCLGHAPNPDVPCSRMPICPFSPLWCNAERMLRRFFGSVTLEQLVNKGVSPVYEGGISLVPEAQARALAYGDGTRFAGLSLASAPGEPLSSVGVSGEQEVPCEQEAPDEPLSSTDMPAAQEMPGEPSGAPAPGGQNPGEE